MSRRRPEPPQIGTPEWDRELDDLGLDRRHVDEELRSALGTTPDV